MYVPYSRFSVSEGSRGPSHSHLGTHKVPTFFFLYSGVLINSSFGLLSVQSLKIPHSFLGPVPEGVVDERVVVRVERT